MRQGCSLSGMLYALSIEPLLHKLRSSLSGLILPGFSGRHVLSAYADDVIILLRTQEDIVILQKVVDDFGVLSAAKVNWQKSEAVALGAWKNGFLRLPGGLSWKTDGLKYLGVFIGHSDFMYKNWDGVLDKLQNKLNKWRWVLPQLSYRGRTLILNNLVALTLWHKVACVEPPANFGHKAGCSVIFLDWVEQRFWTESLQTNTNH